MSFNKCSSDSYSASSAGGKKGEWNILKRIGQKLDRKQKDIDMERVDYDLNKKRVYHPPYTYDPKILTSEDIKTHAISRQNKAASTFKKLINQVKLMETHPIFPVDFKNPHWTSFFQYMDYVKTHDLKESPYALKSRRDAWSMMCKVWGTYQEWPKYQLPRLPDRSRDIVLPTPEKVLQLLQHKYTNDKYLNKLIQYHFFVGFMVGMRPEKEMVILDVDDVSIDDGDFNTIHIVEPKKHGSSRTLRLEDFIAVSKTNKSFKNYIDTIRPRFAERGENALLINPHTCKRWTEDNLRIRFLSKYGCRVWSKYWPYVMRHWSATARCIEWSDDNRVLYRVKEWLGHKKTDQTLKYIQLASLYNQNKGSWLRRALKRRRVGGKLGRGIERISNSKSSFVQSAFEKNKRTRRRSLKLSRVFARINNSYILFVQCVGRHILHKPSGVLS